MKWFSIAVAAMIAAHTPALAQPEGGMPGVYDLSQVTNWIASPENSTSQPPTWFLATYGQINNAGTNCNIGVSAIDSDGGDVISGMLALDPQVYLQGIRAEGANATEIGPITEFDADGNRAIRYLVRSRYESLPLTHLSVQHVAGNRLVSTTCTASENIYGAHAPAIEWFVENIRYVNPDAVNNLTQQHDPSPLMRAGGEGGGAEQQAAIDAARRGIEASSVFQFRNRIN